MKTEGEFNAFLSKEFKKHDRLLAIKTADKYRSGISDFLLCLDGHMVAVESKFSTVVTKAPKQSLLKHQFGPDQQAFMLRTEMAGGVAFGLVGVQSCKLMYLLRPNIIDQMPINTENVRSYGVVFPITSEGVDGLVKYLRWYHGQS